MRGTGPLIILPLVLSALLPPPAKADATVTAARVTPGTAYMAAEDKIDKRCANYNQRSSVPGTAEWDCTSSRALSATCRLPKIQRPGEAPHGVCTAVLRVGVYAPGGINSSDQLWKDTPCWRVGDGLLGWARYRERWTVYVYARRRELDVLMMNVRCKVIRTGNEA